ncbi:MAG: histidinol-phosphate transaminase [Acidiferrobacterales bacterium]
MSINDKVASLIRPEVLELKAYAVPDSTGLIKLDANENPFPWPPEIIQAWLEVLSNVQVNRYPDPDARRLKERLCQAMALPAGMDVLLGNGSDELIQIVLMALARPGSQVLAPAPSFTMYEIVAKSVGMKFISVPLTDSFDLDVPAVRTMMKMQRPAVTFLAYPNAPTGNLFAADDVEAIIRESDGLVVVDEAYFPFTDATFMHRLDHYDNLLVMRTVSKLGLAGLRLGLLVGNQAWLAEFNKVRLPYNVNSLTQASAEFALANHEFLDQQAVWIRAERGKLFAALKEMSAIQVWPSEANFILFRVQNGDATHVYDALQAAGVLVKNLDESGALRGCLRVAVGTVKENEAFLAALRAAV